MRAPTATFIALVSMASLAACGERSAPQPPAAGGVRVLATVNGVPITDRDVDHAARRGAKGGDPDHEASADVLQTLVRDELVYQRAVQLGLDREEQYRARLAELEAQLRAFQRQELSAALRRHVRERAEVTEQEARAFFEKNAASIQARLHVLQILRKGGGAEIAEDHAALKAGAAFEAVAARRYGHLPAAADGRAPWDLGELHWSQVPRSWRGVVDRLEPGQISDVIRGENQRAWVVKLAGRRIDPAITFETERERILEALRQQKADALYDGLLAEARAKARIVLAR